MNDQKRKTEKLVLVADLVHAIHESESLNQRLSKTNKEEADELDTLTDTVVSIAALYLRRRFAVLTLRQYAAFTNLLEFIQRHKDAQRADTANRGRRA
jgi:hypothetical protein